MSYEAIVRFKREYHDDASVIEKEQPTAKDLAVQLAKELQAASNDLGMAGSFQVEHILLNGIDYKFP